MTLLAKVEQARLFPRYRPGGEGESRAPPSPVECARVLRAYQGGDLSIEDIASEFGMPSRRVYRILARARQRGLLSEYRPLAPLGEGPRWRLP